MISLILFYLHYEFYINGAFKFFYAMSLLIYDVMYDITSTT